ncbi:hypothetical protein QFZ60_002750 [Arthrobacter sp. B2I5]|uniref:DUF6221 family protein n=1 Tax=Arthrobacter sp. B2I5 TaxID=3042266 RepID=UPI002780BD81|nr:hypothetical protein [Arthrobacter sp. B2I5]
MDVFAFLEARIRDDEDAARCGFLTSVPTAIFPGGPVSSRGTELSPPMRQRVLNECAAKRAILLHCMLHCSDSGVEVLAVLARVYKDHADYQETWPSHRMSQWPPQSGHAAYT